LRNGERSEFPVAFWRVEQLARVGSTNDEARRRALDGDPGRLWVIADEQTGGRGRRGRVWTSPPGNLYASALLVDPSPVAIASQIGFVAGVALRSAVEDLGGAEIGLKWPNDLIWRGAKLAGLLVEGAPLGGGRMACIIGIGVNCASAPTGLAYPTDHLSNVLGRTVAPEDLFARLAPRFDEALAEWRRGDGFASIRTRWLAGAAGLGGPIRIDGANGLREGIFSTLDDHGRLVLNGAQGAEIVEAGDLYMIKENAGG
jgi:BirA family transcriptional regulator, biotin operon repressor / biotin---[acetyl-CoA-carboxylase] ligase